jgi:protein SCO1/2
MSESPIRRGLRRGLLLASALLALLLVVAVARHVLTERSATGAGRPAIGGAFAMVDQDGRQVTERDFAGKLLLVYFGYTYCPDVCPTELAAISGALDLLGPAAARVTPIFVTVDPDRDSPAVLKEFVGNFGQGFVGLTGSPEQLAAMARAYKVYYGKAPAGATADGYLVDHSGFIYVMGPDGYYLSHFRPGVTPEDIAAGVRKLLASS